MEASQEQEGKGAKRQRNPLDLDSSNFDGEAFVSKLVKEMDLRQLVDYEQAVVADVNRLDAEMQQLIYENYNNFINATDTIRKMKTHFGQMETQMDKLAENMQKISHLTDKVSNALGGRREGIQRLARTSHTLKKLQFLYDLPEKLQNYVDQKEYECAVESYSQSSPILNRFADDLPSFGAIRRDCDAVVDELRGILREDMKSKIASTNEVAKAVRLLMKLNEPPHKLAEQLIDNAGVQLSAELNVLRRQITLKSAGTSAVGRTQSSSVSEERSSHLSDTIPNLPMDVLEFVDSGCSSFLSSLSLTVNTHKHLFAQSGGCSLGCGDSTENAATDGDELSSFVSKMIGDCFHLAEERFLLEKDPSDSTILVRALDRFYRRITATSKLLSGDGRADYIATCLTIVLRVGSHMVRLALELMKSHLEQRMKELRTQLAASHSAVGRSQHLLAPGTSSCSAVNSSYQLLCELLNRLEASSLQELKTSLAHLLQFVSSDATFSQSSAFSEPFGSDQIDASAKPTAAPLVPNGHTLEFQIRAVNSNFSMLSSNLRLSLPVLHYKVKNFGIFLSLPQYVHEATVAEASHTWHSQSRTVREEFVVSFFAYVVELGNEFGDGKGDKAFVNHTSLLILSRYCKNLERSTAGYVLDLCEQQFRVTTQQQVHRGSGSKMLSTPSVQVTKQLGDVAQRLLDSYVRLEGFRLSQLLVKSVEARDWLGCAEPRAVRGVIKRIIEDLTAIDGRVGQLFEEGARKRQSSDSSRSRRLFATAYGTQSQHQRQQLGSRSQLGGSAISDTTLGKIWTERVDYFASVDFNKVAVVTGVVKIALKTLLESVRLRTFGKYGLQQVQVDCQFLQLYLWRFVYDEQLIHCLLDEVVTSAIHRCVNPELMEPSVIDVICDSG